MYVKNNWPYQGFQLVKIPYHPLRRKKMAAATVWAGKETSDSQQSVGYGTSIIILTICCGQTNERTNAE